MDGWPQPPQPPQEPSLSVSLTFMASPFNWIGAPSLTASFIGSDAYAAGFEPPLDTASAGGGGGGGYSPLLIDLYLVRHGESVANLKNIKQGQSNYDLTETGVSQAALLGVHFCQKKWDYCYSSDLTRASDTAKIILSKSDVSSSYLPPSSNLELTPLVREVAQGILENLPLGTSVHDARRLMSEKTGVPIADIVDGIEIDSEVRARQKLFLDNLVATVLEEQSRSYNSRKSGSNSNNSSNHSCNKAFNEGKGAVVSATEVQQQTQNIINVLMVSHGGFIRLFLTSICEHPLRSKLRNCSISKVRLRITDGNQVGIFIENSDEINMVIPSIESLVRKSGLHEEL